jgi:addiction module RelB/DinJ family antitoxin
MADTTVTIRVDEQVKKRFDEFCDDVGINMSAAINMFIHAVIREQQIPFNIYSDKEKIIRQGKEALRRIQEESEKNGLSAMTMEEIDAEIRLARKERRERNADAKNSD